MSPRPRGPMILRLALLFGIPLLAILFVFMPRGDGFTPAVIGYFGALLGLGFFAAPAFVDGTGLRVLIGFALALGMFFVHLFVAFAGCSAIVAFS